MADVYKFIKNYNIIIYKNNQEKEEVKLNV
jgi:hypothetical protein